MIHTSGLHRNANQRVIAGVCSGLADSLKIDAVIVRLIFVLLGVVVGGGVLIYIILWIVLPKNSDYFPPFEMDSSQPGDEPSFATETDGKGYNPNVETFAKEKSKQQLIVGSLFIGFGAILLLPSFFNNIHFADLWPMALIILGIVLLRPSLK